MQLNNLPFSACWSLSDSLARLSRGLELVAKNTAWLSYKNAQKRGNMSLNLFVIKFSLKKNPYKRKGTSWFGFSYRWLKFWMSCEKNKIYLMCRAHMMVPMVAVISINTGIHTMSNMPENAMHPSLKCIISVCSLTATKNIIVLKDNISNY